MMNRVSDAFIVFSEINYVGDKLKECDEENIFTRPPLLCVYYEV